MEGWTEPIKIIYPFGILTMPYVRGINSLFFFFCCFFFFSNQGEVTLKLMIQPGQFYN